MAVSVHEDITIDATKEQVLDVLADVETLPEWSSAHTSAEILETDENGRPARVRSSLSQFGVKDTMILDYTWTPDGLSWVLEEPSSAQKTQNCSYEVSDNGDGTCHVSFDVEVELRIKLPGLVVKRAQKMAAETATKGLKKEVERRVS